jgi:hypothetical protein
LAARQIQGAIRPARWRQRRLTAFIHTTVFRLICVHVSDIAEMAHRPGRYPDSTHSIDDRRITSILRRHRHRIYRSPPHIPLADVSSATERPLAPPFLPESRVLTYYYAPLGSRSFTTEGGGAELSRGYTGVKAYVSDFGYSCRGLSWRARAAPGLTTTR